MDEKDLAKYEASFLTRKEEDKEAAAEILKRHGAAVIKEGLPQKIKLSYPIKKENFGYFSRLNFEVDPQEVKKIAEDLRLTSQVLRFLIGQLREEGAGAGGRESRAALWQSSREAQAKPQDVLTKTLEKVEKRSGTEEPRRKEPVFQGELTNEALEKKLEEILNE